MLGLLLAVYVAVAVVNYSVVQSYIGTIVGNHFSKEWGGTVRVGSLCVMPWNHAILHEVLLVSPDGDTIFDCGTLRLSFKRFPFIKGDLDDGGHDAGTLKFDRVYLGNAYYHLSISDSEDPDVKSVINLQYIIDYFSSNDTTPPRGGRFTVDVGTLTLNHVHYRMDLPDHRTTVYEHGVQIPHMEFYDICARFKNLHVVNEEVDVRMVRFRTEERSGFIVKDISGDVHTGRTGIHAHNMEIETANSRILLDADLVYDNWMGYYLHDVDHRAVLHEGTTVAMSDVAYWAPVLWGYNAQIEACGIISGPIDKLNIDDLRLDFGRDSKVEIDGTLSGLPDVKNARADLQQLDVCVAEGDAERLLAAMPVSISPTLQKLIGEVKHVDMTAEIHGGVADGGTVNMNIASGIGHLRADVKAKPSSHHGHETWRVNLDANSDGLGLSLLGSDWLTHSGLALSAEADVHNMKSGLNGIDGHADVELTNPVIRGNRLDPITARCRIEGGEAEVEALSTDTLLHFEFKGHGDLAATEHSYVADLRIDRIDGASFRLLPERFAEMATTLQLHAKGNTLDSLSGEAVLTNTRLGPVKVRDLRLDVESSGEHKQIELRSDPLDGNVSGNFDYADLPVMLRHMLHEVVPEDLGITPQVTEGEMTDLVDNNMHFNFVWNDDGRLLKALGGKATVAVGTRLSGSYNSRELMKMALRSDSVRIGGILLDDLGLGGRPSAGAYVLTTEAQEMKVGTVTVLERPSLTLNSNQWRTQAELYWGEKDAPRSGDLMLKLERGLVSVMRPYFYVGSTRWALDIDSLAIAVANGFEAIGKGISAASDEQRIEAALKLRGRDDDNISLDIDNFDLKLPCELLLQGTQVDVGGHIGGRFDMYGLTATPYFNANLGIDSCTVNSQPLGDVAVRSNWNAELNILNLQLTGDRVAAHGWIGLGKKEQELDFSVDFNSLELALMAPLMKDFSSRFEGQLHGTLDVTGTTTKPDLTGEAFVDNGALKVDITGVTYYFDDTITFKNKQIHLNDFIVRDPRGDTAVVAGDIRYNSLKDIILNLTLHTDNLLLLDQKRGEQFYGTLLAAADATVRGRIDDMAIGVVAHTNRGCALTVPVSGQRQVKEQRYITFVSDDNEPNIEAGEKRQRTMPFKLSVDLSITHDMKLNLPMDFSEVKVTVGATGMGDLHMDLDEKMQPQVVGSYEVTNGTMKLGMMSMLEKNFTLESGSSLSFSGNLPDARFDLRAVYSQRANLSTLTGSLSAVDNTQKYIQVENIIAVAGTLREPTIGFDLRLPGADASLEDEVFAYIDRNSERDMINQTMSLLLMGQFYNVSGTTVDNGSTVNNGLSSGYSMMASSVSNIVSDMVQFVNVDVNYKAATDVTNEQVDVNISKDWGRWYLESTLGYGGERRELESSAKGTTVLDALLGYRITPMVHVFAYNRTNTNDYTRMDLPYKQGVGLKLTKDFDRWDEMLGIRKLWLKKKTKGK